MLFFIHILKFQNESFFPNSSSFQFEVLYFISTLGYVLLFFNFFLISLFAEHLCRTDIVLVVLLLLTFFPSSFLSLIFYSIIKEIFLICFLALLFTYSLFWWCIFNFHELFIASQLLFFHSSLFWFKSEYILFWTLMRIPYSFFCFMNYLYFHCQVSSSNFSCSPSKLEVQNFLPIHGL